MTLKDLYDQNMRIFEKAVEVNPDGFISTKTMERLIKLETLISEYGNCEIFVIQDNKFEFNDNNKIITFEL